MAIREIIEYGDNEEALRKKSQPVRAVNRRIKKLVQDLKETLLDRPDGIGLAAPQINEHVQIVLVRLGARGDSGESDAADSDEDEEEEKLSPPIALINPEIIAAGDPQKDFDGCLSLPGLYAETVRPHYLKVKGLDEWGKPFEREFHGFDAVVVHHELDHLEGVLFIDRVESINDLYRIERDENGDLVRVPMVAA